MKNKPKNIKVDRNIAMVLREMRKGQKLAQGVLADKMGMSQGDLSRLEHRTDFLLSTLIRWVGLFGYEIVLVKKK